MANPTQAELVRQAMQKAEKSSKGRQKQFHAYVVPAEVLAMDTTAAKIRTLMYLGWPNRVIALSLGIRNQHAVNTATEVADHQRKAAWATTQKSFQKA